MKMNFTGFDRRNACGAVLIMYIVLLVAACGDKHKPPEKDIVKKVAQLQDRISENIQRLLAFAAEHKAKINDSVQLSARLLVSQVYKANKYQAIWSRQDRWQPITDSLYAVISHAKEYGLFPEDYYYTMLSGIRLRMNADSVSRRDAAMWARADALFTDAYLHLAKDLKLGRLERDSITLRHDSLYNDAYFLTGFNEWVQKGNVTGSLQNLEPKYAGYRNIREGMKDFLNTADFTSHTYITYPYTDTLAFMQSVQKRLSEEKGMPGDVSPADTAFLHLVIKKYQRQNGLKPTGMLTRSLIWKLNNTDVEKFKSIALTLDSYKMLPDTAPRNYIMVNIPSGMLYVYNVDTLVMESKVIVGAPSTRTPLLNSKVSNFITYPQWTVPYSIIFKEMLPKIKNDVRYLSRQNLMVVDNDDNVVDPNRINWSKLSNKKFPYLIRQKQGDDNSLGVIKFNFANKYNVYLHDTNARVLFKRIQRALSHGCVRVKEWEQLAHYLISPDTVRFHTDTLDAWMARREKHIVTGFRKVPLFIRYCTVEAKDGALQFFEDVYGYDDLQKRKYFAHKTIRRLKADADVAVQ